MFCQMSTSVGLHIGLVILDYTMVAVRRNEIQIKPQYWHSNIYILNTKTLLLSDSCLNKLSYPQSFTGWWRYGDWKNKLNPKRRNELANTRFAKCILS